MNLIPLMIIFLIAFLIQYILTFRQIKSFNSYYGSLRRQGKVAIGKVKGAYRAGCIAMFSIDDQGDIVEGAYIQGVTVFARCKKLVLFEKMNIANITLQDCQVRKLSKPITKAVLEASSNYRILMCGEEIEMPLSPFEKIGRIFTRKKAKA